MSEATQYLAHTVLARVPMKPQPPEPLTVKEWLDRSNTKHLEYRHAHDDRQHAAAIEALQDAAVARAQAELIDPEHTDLAWRDDGGTHAAGAASHEAFQEPLLRFYVNKLELVRDGDPPIPGTPF